MAFENRKWVIITLADYSAEELENLVMHAIQSSVASLRKSLDGSKALLKWDGATPSVFADMTVYSHDEIITTLSGSDWTSSGGE